MKSSSVEYLTMPKGQSGRTPVSSKEAVMLKRISGYGGALTE